MTKNPIINIEKYEPESVRFDRFINNTFCSDKNLHLLSHLGVEKFTIECNGYFYKYQCPMCDKKSDSDGWEIVRVFSEIIPSSPEFHKFVEGKWHMRYKAYYRDNGRTVSAKGPLA
jgi:hypothetical protein